MIRIDVAQFWDIGQTIYRPLDELSISPEGLSLRLDCPEMQAAMRQCHRTGTEPARILQKPTGRNSI